MCFLFNSKCALNEHKYSPLLCNSYVLCLVLLHVQYVKVGYFFPEICGCFAERKRPNPSKIKDIKKTYLCGVCTVLQSSTKRRQIL